MAKIQVFLVDDHPVVREGIRRLLELEEGISVVGEVASGEEALKQMDARPADVVLMDIRLMGIDGIETTRRLKATHPDLRVLILSGFGHEYMSQAIEAGADGYLLKTAKQHELVRAVEQIAEGQSPIDSNLTAMLLDQFAEMSKLNRSRALVERQLAILRGMAQGLSSQEIAAQLAISDATFKRQLKAIFNYLGANDRAHAVAEAYRRHLL